MSMTARFRLVSFPRDDAAFARCVDGAQMLLDGNGHDVSGPSAAAVDQLLAELRPLYPKVEIRQQDSLASFDSVPLIWYVYRDGVANH